MWESIFLGIYEGKITNRGFLNGPYIPIYGFGGTIIYLFLNKYYDNILLIFTLGFIFATILEYFTALILENILKIRLWSYDNYPLNFQGRICLLASLFWGVMSIMVVKFITPFMIKYINPIHRDFKLIISSMLVAIFILDLIITINSMFRLKEKIKNIIEIENKLEPVLEKIKGIEMPEINFDFIKNSYKHNSRIFRRIIKAFPDLKFKSQKEQNIFTKIKELNKRNKK
jgi:uncharacterized membrane protein